MMWNWGMMNNFFSISGFPNLFWLPGLVIFFIIELFLKGYCLWLAARRTQKGWFVALLVINSLGILPLIYLFLNKDNKKK